MFDASIQDRITFSLQSYQDHLAQMLLDQLFWSTYEYDCRVPACLNEAAPKRKTLMALLYTLVPFFIESEKDDNYAIGFCLEYAIVLY